MGIFSSIKNAVFGGDAEAKAAPTPQSTPGAQAGAAIAAATAAVSQAQQAAANAQVDVAEKLDGMAGSDKLNWRTSIVDLMKLIDVDPSYGNRKELATELGRENYEGSAEDNIWLHKQTMRGLAENGGKVPAEFLD